MNIREFKTPKERREVIEKEKSISLKNIGYFSTSEDIASSRHCENMIGVTQVPLGIAGPLLTISGIKKEYFLPLATTEGALVASVNRGCKAIYESGGATISSFQLGTTRAVVFRTKGVKEGKEFSEFIYNHKKDLNLIAQKTSKHINLTDLIVKTVGRYAFVRLSFDTKDAMGMNMATIASDLIVKAITEKTNIASISIAANYDNDKKPSWINFIRGRGWEVRADIVIAEEVLKNVLKTTAKAMYETWLAKCMVGSAISGSMGFNAQYANIIASIFIATGQDPAHVVEGSLGITTTEIQEKDLYISIYLPDLMIGTVGGGTELETQQEALRLLGVAGGNNGKNAKEFAAVVGGAVLAGEISLLASLSNNTLSSAHKALARKKL